MIGTFQRSLVALSLLTVSVACSQQSKPNQDHKLQTSTRSVREVAAATPAAAEPTCEESWAEYVKANPKGYLTSYQATTVTAYTGGEGLPAPATVIETATDTVTASSEASVTVVSDYTSSAATAPTPSTTQTTTKADFVASCNSPVPTQNPTPSTPAPTVEILDKGTETVAVGAGSFPTDWIKGKITQTGDSPYTALAQEWYMTDSNVLVKSTFEQTSNYDAVVVKTTQSVELIKYVNPAAAPSA